MPVIRVTANAMVFKGKDRKAMVGELAKELAGQSTENGPVIFEIPLKGSDKIDALVVWNKWQEKDVPPQTRSDMILDAYGDKKDRIAQALGVTYKEAMDENLLPYAVVPMARKHLAPPEELGAAMKKHGAFVFDDKVELRFPTMEMAREAHQKLVDEIPKGYWSIVQSDGANL